MRRAPARRPSRIYGLPSTESTMKEMMDPENDPAGAEKTRSGSSVRRYHSIYRPGDLKRAIRQIKGGSGAATPLVEGPDDDNGWFVEADPATLTSEDTNRLRALERIAADPRGHRRRSIVGSSAMVRRLNALSAEIPHFAAAVDLVSRAVLVSARTATPLRLPPILLLGEPGIGKSYTLRRLAEAIGAEFSLIAANLTDAFRLRGLNTAWRGARAGIISDILLNSSTAPIVLVDEIDKAIGSVHERPYDVWHSLLEQENASVYKDDFLEVEIRADTIIWFASANKIDILPSSIVDRFLILEIPTPSRTQIKTIVAGIYSSCRDAYGNILPEHLSEDVLDALARHNPRHIGRLLDLAVGYAAASGRHSLVADDIHRADRLAGETRRERVGFRGRVGFTRQSVP